MSAQYNIFYLCILADSTAINVTKHAWSFSTLKKISDVRIFRLLS